MRLGMLFLRYSLTPYPVVVLWCLEGVKWNKAIPD
jgi:hypothetical protein